VLFHLALEELGSLRPLDHIFQVRILVKREVAVGDLVYGDAQGVEVGPLVGGGSVDDLRGKVVQGSLDGEVEGTGDLFRQPEVDQLHAGLGEDRAVLCGVLLVGVLELGTILHPQGFVACNQYIVRLDIEVDVSLGMDVLKGPADLNNDVVEVIVVDVFRGRVEVDPLDELGSDKVVIGIPDLAEVVDPGQIGMPQSGQGLVLPLGPDILLIQILGKEDLQGDLDVVFNRVLTEVHAAHGTRPQLAGDLVAFVYGVSRAILLHK